jgi:hypothetical protein
MAQHYATDQVGRHLVLPRRASVDVRGSGHMVNQAGQYDVSAAPLVCPSAHASRSIAPHIQQSTNTNQIEMHASAAPEVTRLHYVARPHIPRFISEHAGPSANTALATFSRRSHPRQDELTRKRDIGRQW